MAGGGQHGYLDVICVYQKPFSATHVCDCPSMAWKYPHLCSWPILSILFAAGGTCSIGGVVRLPSELRPHEHPIRVPYPRAAATAKCAGTSVRAFKRLIFMSQSTRTYALRPEDALTRAGGLVVSATSLSRNSWRHRITMSLHSTASKDR